MSWQPLGTVTPIERKWLNYQSTTQAPANPTERLAYRITGLNVQTFDPDKFYALVRFKYGVETYSRSFQLIPNAEPQIAQVAIPPAITTYPFSWIPQIQLVYLDRPKRRRPEPWAVQLDEFVPVNVGPIDLTTLSRFLY